MPYVRLFFGLEMSLPIRLSPSRRSCFCVSGRMRSLSMVSRKKGLVRAPIKTNISTPDSPTHSHKLSPN